MDRKDEQLRIWKEAILAYFKVTYYLGIRTEIRRKTSVKIADSLARGLTNIFLRLHSHCYRYGHFQFETCR
jgi:hypothetical protein